MASDSDKTLAVLAHLSPVLFGFLGPLVILLVSSSKTVKNHARNSLNWQLSLIIYYLISFVLMLIIVGIILLFILSMLNLVFCIIAAVKSSNKELWKYPLSIPFLKVE